MSSSWGKNLKISLFGESHGAGIGVVLDGLPAGLPLSTDFIAEEMARRAPGTAPYATARKEADQVEILSGLYDGFTTGTPLAGLIRNKDTRSKDYHHMPLRPSHGDFTGFVRYGGYNDPRGGGHFSARLTAPLVFAGAVAKQILSHSSVTVGAHIDQIYTVKDMKINALTLSPQELLEIREKDFPVFGDEQGLKMKEEIEKARLEQDSVGGSVTCFGLGLPTGLGSPIFEGLENKLASILFGIPAVRGVEFGTGFGAIHLKGSQHNDPFYLDQGAIKTRTNHHGGILGGISSGMPLQLRVAFKPTPSISQKQQSVLLSTMEEAELTIKGRHDPCVVPRGVPVVESCVAIALLDALLEGGLPHVTWTVPRKD